MYKRLISQEKKPDRSLFLWGARQSGKSTLLRSVYPNAHWIDLLQSDVFATYVQRPQQLRELRLSSPIVVIDEVQKLPQLLDEVHWCIENRNLVFVLCGSSARKFRQGHANLLGGRALRYELHGLSAQEIGDKLDFIKLLNQGYIPSLYDCEPQAWKRLMLSYVGDYLREEIAAESLVRNLSLFSDFLAMAALSDGEVINFNSFARDLGVSAHTSKEYFNILVDTLIAWYLPLYRQRPKRKAAASTKFYFSDVGVVNQLAKRGHVEPGSELFGKVFENWVAHELRCYNQYRDRFLDLSYWLSDADDEVDFIVGNFECAIEAKAVSRLREEHFDGLRALHREQPDCKRRILVTYNTSDLIKDDGIEVLSWQVFLKELWSGRLF